MQFNNGEGLFVMNHYPNHIMVTAQMQMQPPASIGTNYYYPTSSHSPWDSTVYNPLQPPGSIGTTYYPTLSQSPWYSTIYDASVSGPIVYGPPMILAASLNIQPDGITPEFVLIPSQFGYNGDHYEYNSNVNYHQVAPGPMPIGGYYVMQAPNLGLANNVIGAGPQNDVNGGIVPHEDAFEADSQTVARPNHDYSQTVTMPNHDYSQTVAMPIHDDSQTVAMPNHDSPQLGLTYSELEELQKCSVAANASSQEGSVSYVSSWSDGDSDWSSLDEERIREIRKEEEEAKNKSAAFRGVTTKYRGVQNLKGRFSFGRQLFEGAEKETAEVEEDIIRFGSYSKSEEEQDTNHRLDILRAIFY